MNTSPLKRGLSVGLTGFVVPALLNLLLCFFFPYDIALYPVLWSGLAILAGLCSYFHARVVVLTLRVAALEARLSKLERG